MLIRSFASLLVLVCGAVMAQTPAVVAKPAKVRVPNYLDPSLFDMKALMKAPPAQDSSVTRAELAELHRIEASRTPAQVAAAVYDDTHEDIFLYASVLGKEFNAEKMPFTAAFSARIRNDVGVVGPPMKAYFARPRPYNFDASLHPVCATNTEGSYPSGHSQNGFLLGYVLAQMVPEKHAEILARADEYARNRMVCEAHYASDIEASRGLAQFLLGTLLANPRFEREMEEARVEIRHGLGMGGKR